MSDRNSNGRQWSAEEIATEVAKYYDDWRGITITAVILAESRGFEWIRPMVLKEDPTDPSHLSVDRGLCQFNSYWWKDSAPDQLAFDGYKSIELMCRVVQPQPGDWVLSETKLRWWAAYKTGAHAAFASAARSGMNLSRKARGLDPL